MKSTIDKPSASRTFWLKFLSVIVSSSLLVSTVMGSKSLIIGVVLVTSCPGTDDAMDGRLLARNLGMPNNLNASLVDARPNMMATTKKPVDMVNMFFFG